jgi:asparaginyl-tRNA synthetase
MQELIQTENRHKVLNNEKLHSVVAIESELIKAARKYFETQGFTEVIVPHLTKATGSCENVDTMFPIKYFEQNAYLIQTGQLYLESLIPNMGGVYCVGSSFRAEAKVDARHLTEFTLIEIEFPGDLKRLMEHIEHTVYTMIQSVLHNRKKEIETLGIDKERLKKITMPFEKITYTEAIKLLEKKFNIRWGDDLKNEHEHYLIKLNGDKPLFVTHYPQAIKFFNMRTNDVNEKIANSTDLLLPFGGEAVGSAEREWEHDILLQKLSTSQMMRQLEERGGSIKDFDWYLDNMKENGSIPHAGCGFGLNRITQFILGSNDIRTTTAFPMNKESLL